MLKGLNKLQIKARLTRAFIMVAGILATVAVIILVTMVVMSKIYAGTLVDYGFAQGNVGRAMSQLADSRSAMRGIIGYDNQDTIKHPASGPQRVQRKILQRNLKNLNLTWLQRRRKNCTEMLRRGL